MGMFFDEYSGEELRNDLLKNPTIQAWQNKSDKYGGLADEYRDFDSPYYQDAENYYRTSATKSGTDSLATEQRLRNQRMAQGGIDPRSGIGMRQGSAAFNNMTQNMNRQIQDNLFRTQQGGQNMALNYQNMSNDMYGNSANLINDAYMGGVQQNMANVQAKNDRTMGMISGIGNFAGNLLMPGMGGLLTNAATGGGMDWGKAFKSGYQYPAFSGKREDS